MPLRFIKTMYRCNLIHTDKPRNNLLLFYCLVVRIRIRNQSKSLLFKLSLALIVFSFDQRIKG